MQENFPRLKCLLFAGLCFLTTGLMLPAAAQTMLVRQWTAERGYFLTHAKMTGAASAQIWVVEFQDPKGKTWGSITGTTHTEVERERTALAAIEKNLRARNPDTTLFHTMSFQRSTPAFCVDISAPMPPEYGEEIGPEEYVLRQGARALLAQARVLLVQAGEKFQQERAKRGTAQENADAALKRNSEAIAAAWLSACCLDATLNDAAVPHQKRILRQQDALLASLRQAGEEARQLAEKTPTNTAKIAADPTHPTEAEKETAQQADDQGLALYRAEKYAEAKEAFLRACRLNPSEPIAQTHLGLLLEKMESFTEAEAVYRELANYVPTLPAPHYWLGKFLYLQKKYAAANTELGKAIELAPGRWIYHYYLATSLREQGNTSAAAAEQEITDRLRKAQPTETP